MKLPYNVCCGKCLLKTWHQNFLRFNVGFICHDCFFQSVETNEVFLGKELSVLLIQFRGHKKLFIHRTCTNYRAIEQAQ